MVKFFRSMGISTANVRQNGAFAGCLSLSGGNRHSQGDIVQQSAEFSQIGDVTLYDEERNEQLSPAACLNICKTRPLDAIPYGFSAKAPKKFTRLAFSLGGPVTIPRLYNGHDKTFSLWTMRATVERPQQAQQFEVPTQTERNGVLVDSIRRWLPFPQQILVQRRRHLLDLHSAAKREWTVLASTTKTSNTPRPGRTALIFVSIKHHFEAVGYARFSREEHQPRTLRTRFLPKRRRLNPQSQLSAPPHLHDYSKATERVSLRLHKRHNERKFPNSGVGCVEPARSDWSEYQSALNDTRISYIQLQRRYRADCDWEGQGRDHTVEDDAVQR